MTTLEVSARMTIRKEKLQGFKQQAAECIRQTKEKDTKTLRYDWFLSDDQTECEIREAYQGADGLVEHRLHIADALDKLFTESADNHSVTVYGEPSAQLLAMAQRMPPGSVRWYSFFQGWSPERRSASAAIADVLPAGPHVRPSMSHSGATTLRVAFIAGAVTDFLALIPMLFPAVAMLLWGIGDGSPASRFASSSAAALMLGWTALLVWAWQRPVERRAVAALTIIVVAGLALAELGAVLSSLTTASRMAPTWTLQVALVALFATGLVQSRPERSTAA